ncbi:MAG: hypothetical protein AAFU85_15420 [Planctomycetota bacterium]
MNRLEFDSVEAVRAYLATSNDLTQAIFQAIDLCELKSELSTATCRHNVLLGCHVDEPTLALLDSPVVFPQLDEFPFRAFRGELYTPEELLGEYKIGDTDGHAKTLDGRCYQYYVDTGGAKSTDAYVTLARRLHDHSITDALQDYVAGENVVAIMGGHSMPRGDGWYLEVARLARDLTNAGFLVTSGGGPGAMEASHVGAWFAGRTDEELCDAVAMLSLAPKYDPVSPWMDAAFRVRERFPLNHNRESLGIPTWLYGHEPPTCFATRIAKYFANSVREEGLLAIANCGVIFTPGNEGTMQEVFQDAAQNRYVTFDHASPMIFYGEDYWKYRKPIYPALITASANRTYGELISITDRRETIVGTVQRFAKTLSK